MKNNREKMAGARSPRVQTSQMAKRVFIGGALWGGVIVGGSFLHSEALKDEHFGLAHIEVRGLRRATKEEVFRASGLALGVNLLALDTTKMEQRLSSSGWVKTALVSRRFPDALLIEVQEYEPVALVAFGDLFYVDSSGKAFRPYLRGEEVNLPVLLD